MRSEAPLCHVNLARGFRGGERQTELLIRELSTLGWNQRLIVRKKSPLAERVRDIDRLLTVEVASNPVAAGIATRGCQIVHAHEARAIYAGLIGYGLFRIPYLSTRRVPNPFKPSIFRDLAYRHAECIVVLSRSIDALVKQQYADVRREMIPDAHADLARNFRRNQAFKEPYRGKTVVGHIGALVRHHKAQHNIIEIARRWQQSRPDVFFVLVGSGQDEEEFRRSVSDLTNIELAGQVDNVDDYLDLFDIFIFPSLVEGLGSTLLDAMCFGLPIVASNVGGIPDIIEDGANGLLVGPGDSLQLEAALDRLLCDEALLETMRRQNIRKAESYTASLMAKSYDAVYRTIWARQGRTKISL